MMIKVFLKHHLMIAFIPLADHREQLDQHVFEDMVSNLKSIRRRKGMESEAVDRLVRNDVSCLMLIEQLRKVNSSGDEYGFSWWWLRATELHMHLIEADLPQRRAYA